MVTVFGPLRNRGIQPWDLQIWICRWRTVTLHVDEPGRRTVCHAKRFLESRAELAWSLCHHLGLVLFPLMVQICVPGQARFPRELEERVVQNLIVDVQLAHLWMHLLAVLLLQRCLLLLLHDGLADLGDPSRLDEVGQFERRFFDASFPSHVFPLAHPVPRHRACVSVSFQVHQEPWVSGSGVPHLDNVRSSHQGLQLCDRHSTLKLSFFS
mmetsp:Transcript_58540/g.155852  ORF Transcript_58540/g.155852 Transcript_58540/m.155852 type:complete len:211 (+) Transcript_58540:1191-1823(+)